MPCTPYNDKDRTVRCPETNCRAGVGCECTHYATSAGYSHPERVIAGAQARRDG